MADFYPVGGDQARIRWIIIDALRRYGTDSGRIGHAFAELHRLQATGLAFFGSLGDRAHAVLDGFTDEELRFIARFITAMADSTRQYVRELEGRLPRQARANAAMLPASSPRGAGSG